MKKLKVLLKKTGRTPEVIEIDDTLEAKQKLVGGLIEVVPYGDYELICNEEGKLLELYPNIVGDYDIICGNIFLANDDYENAGFKDLTEKDIEFLKEDLEKRSVSYTPTQMKAIQKQEKELDEEFSKYLDDKKVEEYEELDKFYDDMQNDLYVEPTEQDLNEMEENYTNNPVIKINDLSKKVIIDKEREDF